MIQHLGIFNPNHLKLCHPDDTEIKYLACGFCVRDNDSHRAKNLKKPQTLFFHLHQRHKDELGFDFALEILKHVSYAIQLGMI